MKLLKQLYEIQSKSGSEYPMKRFIFQYLRDMGLSPVFDRKGNISVVKGKAETYPCLVAHMDEVHGKRPKDYKVIREGNLFFGLSPSNRQLVGIGADDKNGIWVCLKCLETVPALKCVFFVEEEVGCGGSAAFNLDYFSDCRYVLEADRRGESDFITTIGGVDLCSEEFIADSLSGSCGYEPTHGLLTDVFMLKRRGLAVSCANISCGYYSPHTDSEMTDVVELRKCLRFVKKIIRKCAAVYPHKADPEMEPKKTYRYPSYKGPVSWKVEEEFPLQVGDDYLPCDYFNYCR